MGVENQAWTVTEAKARLSEVIDRALGEGPQAITRSGRPAVIVVAASEWARQTKRKGSLSAFLARSPLRGAALKLERLRDRPRRIKL